MTLDMKDLALEVITYKNVEKSAVENLIDRLEMLGLDIAPKPEGRAPRLPAGGISNLSDDDIADMQSQFVRWMEYAGDQATIQNTAAKDFAAKADDNIRRLKLNYEGSISEREDRAKSHKTVIKLKEKSRDCRSLALAIEGKWKIFDLARGVCSRDVERRRKDLVANVNEDSIRSMRVKKGKVIKRGPMRQRDLEVGRGRK